MLKQRILTACVLLAVLGLALSVAQPWGFTGLILIFAGAAVWEWLRLVLPTERANGAMPIAIALVFSLLLAVLGYELLESPLGLTLIFIASAVIWLALAAGLVSVHSFPSVTRHRGLHGIGSLMLTAACGLALVHAYRQGLLFMLSLLVIVWMADIAAYFSGKAFGRHKLAPAISPGKTWEGVVGAVIVVCIVAALATQIPELQASFSSRLFSALHWLALPILVLLVGISIVGDLFESHLKRQAGVKDSSQLLPGHGGVLDRIDALLPVLPMAMLINQFC